MNIEEKVSAFVASVAPDEAGFEVSESLLETAGAMILNKLYPFGYAAETEVPARYERLQIALAVELFTKRGAEGQVSHAENGITRTWPTESQLLSQVIPFCGSVISNA